MTRTIELVSSNFQLVYTNSIPVTLDNTGKVIYAPIQPLLIPVILDKSIISVNIQTNIPAGSKWFFAGNLLRVISIDSDLHFLDENKELFIGKNILIFEKLTINYQLRISVPEWFENLDVSVYQYEGLDN